MNRSAHNRSALPYSDPTFAAYSEDDHASVHYFRTNFVRRALYLLGGNQAFRHSDHIGVYLSQDCHSRFVYSLYVAAGNDDGNVDAANPRDCRWSLRGHQRIDDRAEFRRAVLCNSFGFLRRHDNLLFPLFLESAGARERQDPCGGAQESVDHRCAVHDRRIWPAVAEGRARLWRCVSLAPPGRDADLIGGVEDLGIAGFEAVRGENFLRAVRRYVGEARLAFR